MHSPWAELAKFLGTDEVAFCVFAVNRIRGQMDRTDFPPSSRTGADGQERLRTQYEPPALMIIGPVTEFTFGSKQQNADGINQRKTKD
jgi:hypothetical protein